MSKSPPSAETPRPEDPVERQQLQDLMDRLAQDEPEVLPELQAWLRSHPRIWSLGTDLARQAEEAALALCAGTDTKNQAIMAGRLRELKTQLAGAAPTPLEQLLADRVAFDWLLLHLADHTGLPNSPIKHPIPLSDSFREQTREQLHQRFTRSVKTLGEVQALLRRRGVRTVLARLAEGGDDPLTAGSAQKARQEVRKNK